MTIVKNKTVQLLFQTIYCTLGVIGVLASLGLFAAEFNFDFYVYYTNLSNYICLGFMFVSLVFTVKSANKKEDGACTLAPAFKFMCMIMIAVTFLVYNILLAKDKTAVEYFTSLSNLTLHLILPIMFILDWVLFYEHGKTKWSYPLLSVVMPLVYVAFILIRSAVVNHETTPVVYPYFFLNVDNLGWGGFFTWLVILIAAFVILGYIIYLLDHIKEIKEKFKSKKNQE
ncbi:MAG: Pr6Pr family membrane protein [Clostridia bacterium]|nr:Pr6Pr family membrane protein [Clostridia bacterium]